MADRAHADFREWLDDRARRHDAPSSRPTSARRRSAPSSASALRLADPADGTVRIASAPDPNREVRDALRTCLRWAREDGIAFHEMVIAYRQADPYRPLIAGALREAKLPAYIDEGTPLAELPLGRRALALLDLLSGDLERASVIAFAADGGFPEATRERFPGSAAAWDGFSRRAGVVRGWRPVARSPRRLPRRRGAAHRRGRQPPRLARRAAGRDRRPARLRRRARRAHRAAPGQGNLERTPRAPRRAVRALSSTATSRSPTRSPRSPGSTA